MSNVLNVFFKVCGTVVLNLPLCDTLRQKTLFAKTLLGDRLNVRPLCIAPAPLQTVPIFNFFIDKLKIFPFGESYLPISCVWGINKEKVTDTDTDL